MTGRWRRTRNGVIAAAAVMALMCAQLAPAAAAKKPSSFAGTCTFQGTVTFSPPATNTPQPLDTWYDATGSCSGELNGRAVTAAPVTWRSGVHGVDGSCRRANTTRPGRGTITFSDGTTIPFTFEFTYVATEGTWRITGHRSGSATAHASFLTDRTSPTVAEQCAGEGVTEIPMDLQLATTSPLVSGGRGHGAGSDR